MLLWHKHMVFCWPPLATWTEAFSQLVAWGMGSARDRKASLFQWSLLREATWSFLTRQPQLCSRRESPSAQSCPKPLPLLLYYTPSGQSRSKVRVQSQCGRVFTKTWLLGGCVQQGGEVGRGSGLSLTLVSERLQSTPVLLRILS